MDNGFFFDDAATYVLSAILIILLYIIVFQNSYGRELPPGPIGLPFVGYLPFLTSKPYIKLQALRKKYGPVYSLKFGNKRVIVLCDYDSIKEAFTQDAFIGRPPDVHCGQNKETLDLKVFNHLPWKDQRRFSLRLLKNLGFGKSRMEGHIREEIEELLKIFRKENGKPLVPSEFLTPSMSNNISSLMFGKRRKFDDPKRVMLDDILKEIGRQSRHVTWFQFLPLLNSIVQFLRPRHESKFDSAIERMKSYVREEIKQHEKSLDPNDIRDFIDGYLLEVKKTKDNLRSTFIVPVLEDLVRLFFNAGSVTVKNALDWLLLASAAFPDVQRRVQSEIDEVIGTERFPSWSDQEKMPYTNAVIFEILRWRASLPVNIPRYTIEDTQLNSYFIPKHTAVVSVFWALHHDPELWGDDVEIFKPERFISENGKETVKPEFFIPFSVGKRSCPGETLAYIEIFMYYTAILQKFHLLLPEGVKTDFEGVPGIVLLPKPYRLCMELRE